MFIKIQFARSKIFINLIFLSFNQISVPEMAICTFLYVFLDLNLYRRSVPEMNSRVCLIEITSVTIKTPPNLYVSIGWTGNDKHIYRGFQIRAESVMCYCTCEILCNTYLCFLDDVSNVSALNSINKIVEI